MTLRLDRRQALRLAAGGALGAGVSHLAMAASRPLPRRRPGDPGWPSAAEWAGLGRAVGGRLRPLASPIAAACGRSPDDAACRAVLRQLRNPYYLGEEPALSQSSGWLDAWHAAPSAYVVAAESARDVAAAVDFARRHALRLVVKGGGHSYLGGSSAPDSLLVWTRPMRAITLHDAFLGQGCEGRAVPVPAVSLGAGTRWLEAYEAVTTRAGRYVQGGGCTTVGVAGLVLGGGFGSFSRRWGLAGANLLEAEIVTADGAVRLANAGTEPELFWALKGGGGGSLGVVTRLTLRTHELPEQFGAVFGTLRASSDDAFRRLLVRFLDFLADRLRGPHWGEVIGLGPDNSLDLRLVFQGLDQAAAQAAWQPFLDWVAAAPAMELATVEPIRVLALPARRLWDAAWLRQAMPGLLRTDERPRAPPGHVFWAGDAGQVGQFLHGYDSAWLPAALLRPGAREGLAAALLAASRHWKVGLHLNKALAEAPDAVRAAARDTPMNPAVLDAFALAIIGGAGPPAFAGQPGPGPDLEAARARAGRIAAAMRALRIVAPDAGAYLSEANWFEPAWQARFWGPHYDRLLAVKRRYDPEGLFFVHHGVGSEGWSADGFTPPRG